MKSIDKKIVVKKSELFPRKWVFTITYADLVNNVKVWRSYPNYISEYFDTKKSAKAELLETLKTH